MKISQGIRELQRVMAVEGDIEMTCTAATVPDGTRNGVPDALPEVYESTVENFIVRKADGKFPKRVRIYF